MLNQPSDPALPNPAEPHQNDASLTQIRSGSLTYSAQVTNNSGPLVVCLHGFPDNYDSFRAQLQPLSAAGYRVICPAMPGYERGNRLPKRQYDMHRVSDALIDLILAIRKKYDNQSAVHLVGHDWGAISGFACIAKAPELFRSFTSLTIPYNLSLPRILRQAPGYLPASWYIQLFQLPEVSEMIVRGQQGQFIDLLYQLWSPLWQVPQSQLASVKRTLFSDQTLPEVLGYYRALYGLSASARKGRQLLNAQIHTPTQLIKAEFDGCIPQSLWNIIRIESFHQEMALHTLPCGHFPHQEMPQTVNSLLLSWLDRQ